MTPENAILGADAPSATSERPTRGRDVREDTHDDNSTESANNPPNHGKNTNYPPAIFLQHVGEGRAPCPAETPVDELGDYFGEWCRREGYDGWSR